MTQILKNGLWAFLLSVTLVPAARADDAAVAAFASRVEALNRTAISISPDIMTEQQLFSMRIIDSGSKVVGRLGDVLVDETGAMVKVVSDIDRSGRHNATVETGIDSVDFRPDISAIQIPLKMDKAQDDSPESLAAISPAAGGGEIFSVKAAKGAEVRSRQGRWVGKVAEVLFDDRNGNVRALVLDDVPGARTGQKIVIPFDPDVLSVRSDYGRVAFTLTPEAAGALNDFAWEGR